MKKEIATLLLGLSVLAVCSQASLARPTNVANIRQVAPSADTTLDPETHLTLDILAELPLGKSVEELARFFDAHKVFYAKLFNNNLTLKNLDLDYFIVDGVAYTFSKFDFKDLSLDKLERLALIKDGKYTDGDSRSLRNKEKQEYADLAKTIEERLRAKFGTPTNGYFKCGNNARCSVVVGKSKTYDGDDIIALYLTFELQK